MLSFYQLLLLSIYLDTCIFLFYIISFF